MKTKHYQIASIEGAVYELLLEQCNNIEWIEKAFKQAWYSFEKDGWKYDGATFVRELNEEYWEIAAFIHDWLNHIGYVGKKADLYFVKIMITLDYGENIIFERCKWMQWTWLNYFWHWLRFKNPKNDLPLFLK
jgi:hypothetical protein